MGGILCSGVDSVRTMTARIGIAEHRAVQCQTGSAPPPLARLFIPGVEALPFPPLEKKLSATTGGLTRRAAGKKTLVEGSQHGPQHKQGSCELGYALAARASDKSSRIHLAQCEPRPQPLPVLYLSRLVSRVPTYRYGLTSPIPLADGGLY